MSEGFYTPEEDVTREQADGTQVQVAVKGVPVPMATARALGLVKDQQQVGPSETKAEADDAPKAAKKAPKADQE